MSRNWSLPKKLVYYTVVCLILSGVVKTYLMWLDSYDMSHPELVEVQAVGYIEELPLDGVLIWDEQLITAPRDGILTYPSSRPRRVAKGEALAALDGYPIRAGTAGYFYPALDGQEGKWVYSRLWPGLSQFPQVAPAVPVESGAYIRKGSKLGKLVPQPQELRCIAYLDRTPSLVQDIKAGFVDIKTTPYGKSRRAEVRTHENAGQKIKVYLTLPFFSPELLTSRMFFCSVTTGNRQGVLVPDTAVILREGRLGVILVQGSAAEFKQVEGFPADEKNFFITKGIFPGNVVVLHADKVKEGVVRLW